MKQLARVILFGVCVLLVVVGQITVSKSSGSLERSTQQSPTYANQQESTAFEHTTSAGNISANSSSLDHAGLNGNPNAIVMVYPVGSALTRNYNALGVWYNGSRWLIFNQNRSQMPEGVTYRIVFYNGEGKTYYTHRATSENTSAAQTSLQHPQLENNPKATVYLTQNWNPGGTGGAYNNSSVVAENQSGRWVIRNLNGNNIPVGAAFNIVIVPEGEVTIATTIIAENQPLQVQTPNPLNVNPGALQRVLAGPGKDVDFDNWGFEKGRAGWYHEGEGDAFVNQPTFGNNVVSQRVLANMEYANGGIGGDYWKQVPFPIGIKGNYWVGTYEQRETEGEPFAGIQGDAPTGTLSSEDFIVTKRFVEFLIGGGSDASKLRVEVQEKLADKSYRTELTRANFRNSEEMHRVNLNLSGLLNKTARIRIVDQATGRWGHINVDDFRFVDEPSATIPLTDPATRVRYFVDTDKPVWGYGDLHAHWVNHVGLRGLMHGRPGGNWRTSDVRRDVPPCDGFNHGLPTITPALLIAQTETAAFRRFGERLGDPGNAVCATFAAPSAILALPISGTSALAGALDVAIGNFLYTAALNPLFQGCGYQFTRDVFAKHYSNSTPDTNTGNFVDFPRWNSFFHQLMHITWVRRSFDGGQRLMVVPVGTAKSWEFITTSDGVMRNPRELIADSVRELKELVRVNDDWLEIALTPQDARRIVLSGKMAIVIGLEQAETGNYGFNSVQEEVNWLQELGVRHVFPIHNIDNKLGGAAVFNSALNSYNDLVNRDSQNAPIVAFQVTNGYTHATLADKSFTRFTLGSSFMRQGMRLIPIAGFGTIPFFYINDVPAEYGYDRFKIGQKNAQGLTSKGGAYITALVRKGMLIDVDHMSDLSQDEAMQILSRHRYPMVAGHANFRELRATLGHPTSDAARQRTEFTIHDRRASEINDAGGMFGVMTQQNDIESTPGNPVRNNAAGGAPSFAQAYWYALQKTGSKKGIAFGSDFNGFAPQIGPRFGVDVAAVLEGDELRNQFPFGERSENNWRRGQAFRQSNGVRYDTSINFSHYHRFAKPSFLTREEREIWEALAIAKSGTNPDNAWQPNGVYERTALQHDKIKNLAKGFLTRPVGNYIEYLDCPEYPIKVGNDCLPERKATFMAVHGEAALPQNLKDDRTMELYRVVKPIYDLWMQFENGPNEPLRRSFAYPGGRDFDFNLDGLAHYGMFPDMIQDLKNTGLTSGHLTPLFLGAEEYIRMWEKADAAKNN